MFEFMFTKNAMLSKKSEKTAYIILRKVVGDEGGVSCVLIAVDTKNSLPTLVST